MNADQRLLAMMAMVYGSFYLFGCFVAGMFFHAHAWKMSLASFGVCYLSAIGQTWAPTYPKLEIPAQIAFGLSIALGLAAGLALLFRW